MPDLVCSVPGDFAFGFGISPLPGYTLQEMEEQLERERFLAAIREAEKAIQEGRVRPAEEVFAEMKAKYGF
jgi:hypothetical protein